MNPKPTVPTAPGDPDSTNRAAAKGVAAAAAALPLDPAAAGNGSRRPYQAPRILFREPLEAMAAICTPHPPAKANKGACPMGPISS